MPINLVRPIKLPLEAVGRSSTRLSLLAGLLAFHPIISLSQTVPAQDGLVQKQVAADENHASARANGMSAETTPVGSNHEYRIGADDLVEINVFDAEELNRKLRVSASGELSVPLIGAVQAGGLTAQELEAVLESRLREYLKEPHVGVFVSAVESHPISVLGAVKKPGVFQVRGPKTVLEMLKLG